VSVWLRTLDGVIGVGDLNQVAPNINTPEPHSDRPITAGDCDKDTRYGGGCKPRDTPCHCTGRVRKSLGGLSGRQPH
jgi:hypothetical protein